MSAASVRHPLLEQIGIALGQRGIDGLPFDSRVRRAKIVERLQDALDLSREWLPFDLSHDRQHRRLQARRHSEIEEKNRESRQGARTRNVSSIYHNESILELLGRERSKMTAAA